MQILAGRHEQLIEMLEARLRAGRRPSQEHLDALAEAYEQTGHKTGSRRAATDRLEFAAQR